MPPPNPFYNLIGLNYLEAQLVKINEKLDKLVEGQLSAKERDMAEAEEIQNLIQKVGENRDLGQSIVTAMQGLTQTNADLMQELQNAIANAGTDVSADIKAAADDLQANNEALQAAIPQIATAIQKNTKAA